MATKDYLLVLSCFLGYSYQMRLDLSNSSLSGNFSDALGLTPSHYYMNYLCKSVQYFNSRNAILLSPWPSKYPTSTQTCSVGIKNVKYWNYRYVTTFKKMKLHGETSRICIKSRLDLFNGHTIDTSDRLNDVDGLCGTRTKRESYSTTTSFLTLVYETNQLPSGESQYFEAVITPFHRGTCKPDEFKCKNGNCIKNNMLCDSYNNCGDDSDEDDCAKHLAVAIIVGIVVGCVVFLAIVIGIIVCCCCCGWCCAMCTYESL